MSERRNDPHHGAAAELTLISEPTGHRRSRACDGVRQSLVVSDHGNGQFTLVSIYTYEFREYEPDVSPFYTKVFVIGVHPSERSRQQRALTWSAQLMMCAI